MEQLMEELYSQLELPSSSDFVALAIGHGVLVMLCMLGLWAYVSVRMYRVHSRRLRGRGQPSLLQMLGTTSVWVLGALTMAGNFAKLGLMVVLELLVFPVGVGFWLDVCVLPLSQATLAERVAQATAAPLLSCFVHWVLGIGFLLAYTYGVMVARDVLRPGALPFLKDPSRADRNPFLETMARPLHKLLSRLVLSSLVAAGLCVVTVHLPALLAKAFVPQLLPLRVNLFDQLTAIPADLLLSHIFLPFALEHVKLREACRAFTRAWLGAAGWWVWCGEGGWEWGSGGRGVPGPQ
jgi:E3 ubiquitin-protein ligase MARCH6